MEMPVKTVQSSEMTRFQSPILERWRHWYNRCLITWLCLWKRHLALPASSVESTLWYTIACNMTMENRHVCWENSLFLSPCSLAMLVIFHRVWPSFGCAVLMSLEARGPSLSFWGLSWSGYPKLGSPWETDPSRFWFPDVLATSKVKVKTLISRKKTRATSLKLISFLKNLDILDSICLQMYWIP